MKYEPTELGVRLGENVRTLREEAGLTQQALAAVLTERLGVDIKPITVLRIEKGTRATSVDELGALAAVLQVPTEHLINLESSELGPRAELQKRMQRTQLTYLAAMSAVGDFEDSQRDLEEWWHSAGAASQIAKSTEGAERRDATNWVDRNRARGLLKVKFEETEREVEI